LATYRIPLPYRCFLLNLVEINPVVLEKKSFKEKVYARQAVIPIVNLTLKLRRAKYLMDRRTTDAAQWHKTSWHLTRCAKNLLFSRIQTNRLIQFQLRYCSKDIYNYVLELLSYNLK